MACFLFMSIKTGCKIIFKGIMGKLTVPSLFLVTILVLVLVSSGCASSPALHTSVSNVTTSVPDQGCDYTENISTGVAPLTVQFSDPCCRSSLTSRHWGFGDGNSSDQQNPVHTYMSPGIYEVTFTIDNGRGSISTEMSNFKRIFVVDHAITLPTVNPYWIKFSPLRNNITSGEIFFINGTTNLPDGENLSINLDTFCNKFRPHMKNEPDFQGITISNISIKSNGSGTNRWSVNMTDFAIQYSPNKYCTGWEQLSPSNPQSSDYRCDPGCSHWRVWGGIEGPYPYSIDVEFYILPSNADIINNVTPPSPPFFS